MATPPGGVQTAAHGVNPRRPKRGSYKPRPETLELLKVSGNPINGLGETTPRRPSPFLWRVPRNKAMTPCLQRALNDNLLYGRCHDHAGLDEVVCTAHARAGVVG